MQDFIDEDEKIEKLITKKMKAKPEDNVQNGEPYVKHKSKLDASDNLSSRSKEFDFFDEELGAENEDLKKAYKKMKRLDELLGDRMKKEKEVRHFSLLY